MVLPVATDDSQVQAWVKYSEKRKKKITDLEFLQFFAFIPTALPFLLHSLDRHEPLSHPFRSSSRSTLHWG